MAEHLPKDEKGYNPAEHEQCGRDVARAYRTGLSDARTQIVRDIEAARNEHWQQHLRDHPYANGSSCPRDYGIHDAYASAVNIARGVTSPPAEGGGERG